MYIRKILQTNSHHIIYNYISTYPDTYLIRLSTIWFKMMNKYKSHSKFKFKCAFDLGTLDLGSMNSKSINKLGIANEFIP